VLDRLSLAILIAIALSTQQSVGASSVTYHFSGALEQPVTGAKISGPMWTSSALKE
jgi:hypothetical protein